ncbi:MAG: glycosyltransferase family 9 protein [Anaerolineales bacterium]|nr:glycosyltransferase family 9 protein [Anaerolineales bacterium]
MLQDTPVTAALARLLRLPFWLFARRPFTTPKKILILKPCCVSQVMLATPLLAVLSEAFPDARIDWAVSEWARPAIAANPRLTELLPAEINAAEKTSWQDVNALIALIRHEGYDTCFIPSRSSLLAYIAWRAGIPQRIGLHVNGRGFAHTLAVRPAPDAVHEADVYLALAQAIAVDPELLAKFGKMEFYPPDADRTAVTARLVEDVDWLGEEPLVLMHPGGGHNPVQSVPEKQWPAERFARLGNHLARTFNARIILVGAAADKPLTAAVAGIMSVPVINMARTMGLGELGALCEVADLYIGNDAGPTHIAAAIGCPTLAIFGPSQPTISGPYTPKGRKISLRREGENEVFSWADGVSTEEAIAAATQLLAPA